MILFEFLNQHFKFHTFSLHSASLNNSLRQQQKVVQLGKTAFSFFTSRADSLQNILLFNAQISQSILCPALNVSLC